MIVFRSKFQLNLLVLLALISAGFILLTTVQAQNAVVRAVLFFSPTCPHCTIVKNEILAPLQEQYGSQMKIAEIDISQRAGLELYRTAAVELGIPQDRLGVPTLIIGGEILVGSDEIPAVFPGLVEKNISAGGTAWPKITGLEDFTAGIEAEILDLANPDSAGTDQPAWLQNFMRDPAGNLLAVITLLVLVGVCLWTFILFVRGPDHTQKLFPVWVVPGLSLLGVFVAAYMTYVETTQTTAFCGPIGDCNSVQQSQFAFLFGFLPVGLLGIVGYIIILLAWLPQVIGPAKLTPYSHLSVWLLSFFGTLFSIYLTFLEPFVIGATCVWCISSALIMAALLWVATPSAVSAWQTLFEPGDDIDQSFSPSEST